MKVIKITTSVAASTTNIYVASGNVIQVGKALADSVANVQELIAMFESDTAEAASKVIGFPDNNVVEEWASKYSDWETQFELPKAQVLNLFGGK